jgi:hypothetical protein
VTPRELFRTDPQPATTTILFPFGSLFVRGLLGAFPSLPLLLGALPWCGSDSWRRCRLRSLFYLLLSLRRAYAEADQ